MDVRIRTIVDKDTVIEPIFFIQSRSLYKLWKRVFRKNYSTSSDIFKQAFSFQFGDEILTWKRMEKITELARTSSQTKDKMGNEQL